VADTDAEGRLILADALYYLTSKFKPHSVIDLATLTGAMDVALGVFTNSDALWHQLNQAATRTSDAFWRMPLHPDYLKPMRASIVADLINIGNRSGGSCTAAAFLKEFVLGLETPVESTGEEANTPTAAVVVKEEGETIRWAHIDIAGVMESKEAAGYTPKGMSGRPTRSLIEFARNAASQATEAPTPMVNFTFKSEASGKVDSANTASAQMSG
ncbi:cytosol aminopeptidase family, catalytic domain-containing protein, partial [Jimgerdemannia flammicorona]